MQDSTFELVKVEAGNGINGLCVICERPFHHFNWTATVVCHVIFASAKNVCRSCAGEYADLDFAENADARIWMRQSKRESYKKADQERRRLIDAIREHAHFSNYFQKMISHATKLVPSDFEEWR